MAKHSTCSSEFLDSEFGASNDWIIDYGTGHFADITSYVIADLAQTLPSVCSSSEVLAKHSTGSSEILDGEFGAPNGHIVDYETGHFVVKRGQNEHMLGANCARFELQTESASKTMQRAYEINAEQDAVDQSVVLAQGSMTHVSCDYHYHPSTSPKQSKMEHGETY